MNSKLEQGIWHVQLSPEDIEHGIIARVNGAEIPHEAEKQDDCILLRVPLPPISEGVQVLTLDVAGGAPLASLAIKAGAAAEEDTEAELAILRAELELVKRFLRQVLLNPL